MQIWGREMTQELQDWDTGTRASIQIPQPHQMPHGTGNKPVIPASDVIGRGSPEQAGQLYQPYRQALGLMERPCLNECGGEAVGEISLTLALGLHVNEYTQTHANEKRKVSLSLKERYF